VEVSAEHSDLALENEAIQAAFERIFQIEKRLNGYDPNSEISTLNKRAHIEPVTVSKDTYAVLEQSLYFFELSNGVFDCTCQSETGTSRDIQLLTQSRVRFLKPLSVNFGGIAKGFAVDCAIETMTNLGISTCCVNAGGDLRYCGEEPPVIWNRVAPHHYQKNEAFRLTTHKAMATSFPNEDREGLAINQPINGQTKVPVSVQHSVTIVAETCMQADALTKVVLIMGESSQKILETMNAFACVGTVEH
jgi:thiamine biosynthesis lipoprotein